MLIKIIIVPSARTRWPATFADRAAKDLGIPKRPVAKRYALPAAARFREFWCAVVCPERGDWMHWTGNREERTLPEP